MITPSIFNQRWGKAVPENTAKPLVFRASPWILHIYYTVDIAAKPSFFPDPYCAFLRRIADDYETWVKFAGRDDETIKGMYSEGVTFECPIAKGDGLTPFAAVRDMRLELDERKLPKEYAEQARQLTHFVLAKLWGSNDYP